MPACTFDHYAFDIRIVIGPPNQADYLGSDGMADGVPDFGAIKGDRRDAIGNTIQNIACIRHFRLLNLSRRHANGLRGLACRPRWVLRFAAEPSSSSSRRQDATNASYRRWLKRPLDWLSCV